MFQIKYIYDFVDKVSPSLKRVEKNMQNATRSIKRSAGSMRMSFDKMSDSIKKVGTRATQLGKSLFIKATLPISLLAAQFIKSASDFEESINKVNVVFGDFSKSVIEFSKTTGKNFGIDRGRALDMAALFGDMWVSMGLSTEQAKDMSMSLVGLAGDVASFKNLEVEQAQTALTGIYTSETESLKKLGVVMTQANLQQFAMSRGIRKKISDMKQDQQVMLRYNFVTSKMQNAIGDFKRTREGFANQLRALKTEYNNLSITMGRELIPHATKLVEKTGQLISWFNALSPSVRKNSLVIIGLVAVAAPLLLLFGSITAAITILSTKIGLVVLAVTALGTAFLVFHRELLAVYDFLKDKFLSILDSIGNAMSSVGDFLGFGAGDSNITATSTERSSFHRFFLSWQSMKVK